MIGTFCCFVHFFASEEIALEWTKHRPGSYVVTIAQGFEYGRLYNHARFGAALEELGRRVIGPPRIETTQINSIRKEKP